MSLLLVPVTLAAIVVLSAIVVAAAAFLYQSIGAARDRRRYPLPGRLVDVNGTKLHVHAQGRGEPTVVLESGIGASSLSWAKVQPAIAEFTRVVSYDRAGLGWSARAELPRSVLAMMDELHSLLSQVDAAPPYVLVGHSFGGLLVRAYAGLYPHEVAGLVLIDPVSLVSWANCSGHELAQLQMGVMLAKRGRGWHTSESYELHWRFWLREGAGFRRWPRELVAGVERWLSQI